MDTIKYVIKRLLLAVIILLGVSVIIYGLARMMPVDFVDQQFAGAIQQGTMTQDDLDRIKELYGLNLPDAFLTLVPGDGSEYDGVKFQKNTKVDTYENNVKIGNLSHAEWYVGRYSSGSRQLRMYDPDSVSFTINGIVYNGVRSGNTLTLYIGSSLSVKLNASGTSLDNTWTGTGEKENSGDIYTLEIGNGKATYSITNKIRNPETKEDQIVYKELYENFVVNYGGKIEIGEITSTEIAGNDSEEEEENEEETSGIVVKEVFEVKETGTYTVLSDNDNAIKDISLTLANGNTSFRIAVNYRPATGWDKFVSIIKSYFNWLGKLFQGDLGMSFKYKEPVGDVIMRNMGISFAIAFVATILQFVIAIPLGIKAAVKQYGVIDYTVTIFTMIGISLPTFFMAALVIRVFAVGLGWFDPAGGLVSASLPTDASQLLRFGDIIWHMILPMFVLVVLSIGGLMRYTRTNTLEALNADYVRTARAKGLSERTVIYKHAFRNTMVPLVTLLAGTLPSLFSGAMITETVFAIPGIGKMAYDALVVADVPFIMGYNMFLAVLTVLGTLLSDLMYAVVDPRVKIGK